MNRPHQNLHQRPYKIALIGSQCVGKTTTLQTLKKIFSNNTNVYFLDEGARIFFDTHPDIADRGFGVQKRIQDFVLQREQQVDNAFQCIVTDRSVIDPIIMAQIWDSKQNAIRLYKNVESWIKTYSFFFILSPFGVTSLKDKHRKETMKERLIAHRLFISFCQEYHLPYKVVSGTLEEKIEKIKRKIDQVLNTT